MANRCRRVLPRGNPLLSFRARHSNASGHRPPLLDMDNPDGDQRLHSLGWQKMADEIAIVRSMVTDQINHDPAHTVMNTGTSISGRPSMGTWVNYGLGSLSEDLPGFVVLTSQGGRNPSPSEPGSGTADFCPDAFRGLNFNPVVIRCIMCATQPGSPEPASAIWWTPFSS